MSGPTPGPWEVCGNYIRTWRGNSAGLEVARVDFTASHFDDATRVANARVLAAGPELLEALHNLLVVLGSNGINVETDTRATADEVVAATVAAQAAIAKATGEAP